MNVKAKEAQPILKRDQHYFKIVTLYVMDKFNFNLMRQQKAKELNKFHQTNKAQSTISNQQKPEVSQSNIGKISNESSGQKAGEIDQLSQYSGSHLNLNEEIKVIQSIDQKMKLGYVRVKRSASTPIKQIPNHFNHGDRNYKKCIVCECQQKNNQKSKDQNTNTGTLTQTSSNQLKDQRQFDDQIPKKSHKDIVRQDSQKMVFALNQANDTQSINNFPLPAPSVDFSDAGNQLSQMPILNLQRNQSTRKQAFKEPLSPTKRDQEIEEFQKRRISLNDFIQGTPSIQMTFSKHVRKFNRELLKATCQVIGCKPINANQIAEGVFDEINQILNNLSQSIDFDMHFDIKAKSNEIFESSEQEQARQSSKNKYSQITTITTSAPFFKYVLKSKRNILVLLAGTSGTGKSTLASLLGSRLGISTVLSTDTIRHVMRNFVSKEENPILFASTYETAAFAPPDVTSEKKRTLMGYKEQCHLVQQELEKIIDDYQKRNESLVVEGVHLTVRFIIQTMKKYPSCIPFVLCIKNEEKHKERFAVRTKHMTIDPRFNKYIKNVKSIRIIQKHLIKKAEAALIPRIDNSNVDKSLGLIHVTIVRCLRQIAEGAIIFDQQRKQATIMHHEYNLISKNQLSSRDAQQIIKQKVNKHEILEMYMQKTNPEIEDKLKKYKRGQSMGDLKKNKFRPNKSAAKNPSDNQSNPQQKEDSDLDDSPKSKSVHIILRQDEEDKGRKITDQEKKNMKKQFLNIYNDFAEDEGGFEDSEAAKLAAQSSKQPVKPKKDKKEKVYDSEKQKLRDEKKRISDQQRKIEEEKIQSAINEAKKKEKEEQEKIEAETKLVQENIEKVKNEKDKEKSEQEKQMEVILMSIPKSQSMQLPSTQPGKQSKQKSERQLIQQNQSMQTPEKLDHQSDRDLSLGLDESEEIKTELKRQPSQNGSPIPINIINIKDQIKIVELQIQQQSSQEIPKILRFKVNNDDLQDEQEEMSQKYLDPNAISKKVKFTAETKSMTSLEHLKQMETMEENISKISSDDASQEPHQLGSKSVGRVALKDKKQYKQASQFKKEREREDFKSLEPEKQLVDLGYNQKINSLDAFIQNGSTPEKINIQGVTDLKAQFQSRLRLPGGGSRRAKGKKKGGLRSANLFTQYSFGGGTSNSQTPGIRGTHNLMQNQSPQSQVFSSHIPINHQQTDTNLSTITQGKQIRAIPEQQPHDDNQSQYSGNSGLAPSLVSHTINYFPQGKNIKFLQLQAVEQKKTTRVQCLSNQMKAEVAPRIPLLCMQRIHFMSKFYIIYHIPSPISEEVSYSQSTDSDHEEENVTDVIQQKEASFNNQAQSNNNQNPIANQTQMIKNSSSGSGSPQKESILKDLMPLHDDDSHFFQYSNQENSGSPNLTAVKKYSHETFAIQMRQEQNDTL
ncbi:UNKNOWN [Stylonychia lemnae]|uniref:Uncharacterized protein n=1 Tax=Stylonychia lemnae TaxID=5949 RepID=A0A078A9T7_STYLE|nr:UNKNOWN [Stylonychia lemnae]|eukprot:CDW78661.1 UNKNOWN [Stylonychia lemnae]